MDKRVGGLKVALVGVYPPPYGGVAIYVQRLYAECLKNNIQCTVFNSSRYIKRAKHVLNLIRVRDWPRILIPRQDIIHVQTGSTQLRVPMVFFCLSKLKKAKYILTYHSLRYSTKDFGLIGRRVIGVILKSASHCITTNSELEEKLVSLGAKPERISVIPPFLPPVKKAEEIAEIPQEVWDFIESRYPVVSANAYQIRFYNNQDLYGIDMCIDLCANLRSVYPEIGFIFCLTDVGDYDYFSKLKRRIADKNIENNFFFVTKPYQYYPVLMKSHIFVRPTNTDGDAVSLREALYFKVPSVASDVVPRPEGTVLFGNRDTNDLTLKVREVLANYEHYKKKLETVDFEDFFQSIMRIYQKVASE